MEVIWTAIEGVAIVWLIISIMVGVGLALLTYPKAGPPRPPKPKAPLNKFPTEPWLGHISEVLPNVDPRFLVPSDMEGESEGENTGLLYFEPSRHDEPYRRRFEVVKRKTEGGER